ncbi:hypothetical protein EES41_03095 [Streptomyces sp. ADI95-16]|uniref:hypothetical protein n=1 Tax=Streptomyces sp. ADI95-16 TaxID=1522758 RepID=UPI000F42FE15|nr:hypothetical protein [Streptomyces sp. ADI95-16]AYV25721.1 hypothetical protein EES41_03095 [Streptomyces sp. ADI95-16]
MVQKNALTLYWSRPGTTTKSIATDLRANTETLRNRIRPLTGPDSRAAASAALIVSGTREGLDAACGRVGGRPTVATPEQSITSIAKVLGVSPGTLYNHIPDLQELRASGRVPNQVTAS